MSTPARLWTADELLQLESLEDPWELWDGRLLVRSPSGGRHGPLAVAIASRLYAHVQARPARAPGDDPQVAGWVGDSSTGYLVARNPDRVLSPDVSFVSRAHLDAWPERGFVPLAPDFAVEVRSPTDSWIGVVEKCGIWRGHGVPVVWAVEPLRQQVVEFRAGAAPREVGVAGVARADPAVIGFEVAMADLFAGFGEPSGGAPATWRIGP